MPFEITKWVDESELEGSIDAYVAKFDDGSLDGSADFVLFFKAMAEAGKKSGESEDEDKKEYAEIMRDDVEEYESLAYFTEVRGVDEKLVQILTPDVNKLGFWEGTYDEAPSEVDGTPIKNAVFMEMTPETMMQLMKGNPNTDAQFFSGDLTVKGSLKLATKPREWI
ncbi:MAG TPA: SCP2 sterol-binding domain-containing protein, partial [Candidatus Lokiarchaeia archaeon]|nr:SCP2 sterol-binding domain-containing protein [Candidatus Lokiarchaeia archaeon]